MSGLALETPPEPLEVRKRIRELYEVLSGQLGSGSERAAVWSGNLLARYLWGEWGGELKKMGFSWPTFLSALKAYTSLVARWAITGDLSWEELVDRIRAGLASRTRGGLERFLS
ncbi:hypothetical protein IG193_08370 [Infirmifilum lucidum]|uniref:Uncharacterized protein n=1 Tax=Infirmifilum lucidum TaxID=2776706 RepID=A0A7L9FG71_9CREN|nr:hypothetical protein [Infirmifilum lucidum]QOJ78749.1 hypothetical protein IG193_08370 [Infirmifilum lucidum]